MKDFYGTSLPTANPELDYQNWVIINNAFSDASKKVQSYTPTKDGIFIIGCSYQAGAYAWIVDEVLSSVRRVSCVIASGGAVAQMNGTCQAYKGHNYRCESVRGAMVFHSIQVTSTFFMKAFDGTKIRSLPLIDYRNQSMIYAHDGNRYTVGTPDSSNQINWTCPHDGYLICHIWGNNSGKLEIKDLTNDILVMTLSQPTSNVGGPNRAWIPVYAGVQYRVLNSARTSQATFYPFAN